MSTSSDDRKLKSKTSLTRSFTARYNTSSPKKRSSRQRTSSFSAFFRRRPSSSQLSTSANTPFPDNSPSDFHQASSSFLTVNDSVRGGGTSSVDSGSDDDDDDIDHNNINNYNNNSHLHPSTNSNNDANKTPNLQLNTSGISLNDATATTADTGFLAPTSAPLEKKLSTSFKEKLHLSRRSQSTKIANHTESTHQSVFRAWRSHHHHHNDNGTTSGLPKLYDDGKGLYPPPQTIDPNRSRDQYRFVRSTQWVTAEEYDAFEQQYLEITQRRSQKWRTLLEENNGDWPPRSSKFKRYVRKGIPPEFRSQAWFHYSGGQKKMQAHVGVYQECVDKAMAMGLDSEYLDIIERDLHRTFPDNDLFKSKNSNASAAAATTVPPRPQEDDMPAIQKLRRLLYAFSVYSPSIGYCQSLNYIAGLLLLFMEEEEAFWTFVVLIHDILPPNVYDTTMEGANIDQNVLMMLLSERCPRIWQRLADGRSFWECEDPNGLGLPTSSLVTSHWFLTLFINILPTESVLRVWDCLFYEGRKALMRTALAIFKLNEHQILSVTDPLEVFQVVQNMPKRMVDCHKLMDCTYHKYASITRINDQDLERRRQLFKTRREERRKNKNTSSTTKLKRGGVAGTILFKAKEARRFVERAKPVRPK